MTKSATVDNFQAYRQKRLGQVKVELNRLEAEMSELNRQVAIKLGHAGGVPAPIAEHVALLTRREAVGREFQQLLADYSQLL